MSNEDSEPLHPGLATPPSALPEELMDGDSLTLPETERALADLRRINALLLGYGPVLRTLMPRLAKPGAGAAAGQPLSLLDLGTGTGDVVEVLAGALRRRGHGVRVVGLDSKLRHLLAGRRSFPRQLRVVASAEALPFADGAVHWSLSTLFFHHFGATTNRAILEEMRRVASTGAAVVDLRASRWLRLLIRPLLRLAGAGHVAYTDGALSAAAAWSLTDLHRLLEGTTVLELRKRFPFRFSLILPPRDGHS